MRSVSNSIIVPRDKYFFPEGKIFNNKTGKEIDPATAAFILKGLLISKGGMSSKDIASMNPALLEGLVQDALTSQALAIPVANLAQTEADTMELASTLADILSNPTEEQKAVLDVVASLLEEAGKMGGEEKGAVEKASDGLIQAVATILVAQAIPDLLNADDISNIKGIFSELGTVKGKVLSDYQNAIKPYYDEMKKALVENMNALQLNNVISKNTLEKELENLPPIEIDRIISKMKNSKDKTPEAASILREESRLRGEYLDPNKKAMEDNMKVVLDNFTKRLYDVIEIKAPGKGKNS